MSLQTQVNNEASRAKEAFYNKALQDLTLFKSKTNAALLQVCIAFTELYTASLCSKSDCALLLLWFPESCMSAAVTRDGLLLWNVPCLRYSALACTTEMGTQQTLLKSYVTARLVTWPASPCCDFHSVICLLSNSTKPV